MKASLLFVFVCISQLLMAQWSDTDNKFYDSLHTPVCTATGEQLVPLIIRSYPDSGYFVIWEDYRGPLKQIYAQKYDRKGIMLWAPNGVPISTPVNSQHFSYSANNDYRSYSVAASDNANGFYIAYADDSISNYVWQRLMVQHIKADGSPVFSGPGSIIYTSTAANLNVSPQLIADGNGGFFVSHYTAAIGEMNLYVFCYKDVGGQLKYMGGGQVNRNGVQTIQSSPCGNVNRVVYYSAFVLDYMIYPDLQNGCNVVMTFSQNGGVPGDKRQMTATNWLWRVKKDTVSNSVSYKKDSVILFYDLNVTNSEKICGTVGGDVIVVATSTLNSNGFAPVSDWVYAAEHTRGAVVKTDGNINANIVTANNRGLVNTSVSDWFTRMFIRKQEIFESIPYAYKVAPFYPQSFLNFENPALNKLGTYSGHYADTLIYDPGSTYYYDYDITAGGNKFFATAITNLSPRNIMLQQLQVKRITSDSFALQLTNDKKWGVNIGKELRTGYGGTDIYYGNPRVAANAQGRGFFYVLEIGRSTRVSPILDGAVLAWGAMGQPTGSGKLKGFYYPLNPFAIVDPQNGTGLVAWNDYRIPPSTGNNIYMRHLDNLNNIETEPPYLAVKKVPTPYGAAFCTPGVLLGTSGKWTNFSDDTGSPVAAITDNFNLGSVMVTYYENNGSIRKANGKAYLDRNISITPQNIPSGVSIPVRFFFTLEEFNALKAEDPSITSPADLGIIKQPATAYAPAVYTFTPGEKSLPVTAWGQVPGGYYIETTVTEFSHFFIQKATSGLPLTWVDIQAFRLPNSLVQVNWSVANQINVQSYTVQKSADGTTFSDECIQPYHSSVDYNCKVPADDGKTMYFRIKETDIDGRISYSKVVKLEQNGSPVWSVFPNPVSDVLYVKGAVSNQNYRIMNLQGAVIQSGKLESTGSIQVSHLKAGAYYLSLQRGNENLSFRFVKL